MQSALQFAGIEGSRVKDCLAVLQFRAPPEGPYPNCTFNFRGSIPIVILYLLPNWMEDVHARGLHNLPWPPRGIRTVMVLHAGDHLALGTIKVSPAVWTNGRARHEGWLAWDEDYWKGEVTRYCTASTMQRAINGLAKWPAATGNEDIDILGKFA